jgi:hypothetical protein
MGGWIYSFLGTILASFFGKIEGYAADRSATIGLEMGGKGFCALGMRTQPAFCVGILADNIAGNRWHQQVGLPMGLVNKEEAGILAVFQSRAFLILGRIQLNLAFPRCVN